MLSVCKISGKGVDKLSLISCKVAICHLLLATCQLLLATCQQLEERHAASICVHRRSNRIFPLILATTSDRTNSGQAIRSSLFGQQQQCCLDPKFRLLQLDCCANFNAAAQTKQFSIRQRWLVCMSCSFGLRHCGMWHVASINYGRHLVHCRATCNVISATRSTMP